MNIYLTHGKFSTFLLAFMLLLLATACAKPGLYYWGDYEPSLTERYLQNDNAQAEAYVSQTIQKAEQQNLKVPPGVYADYGFMQYRKGDKAGAIKFFNLEKNLYPEATALMNKLIERINKNDNANNEVKP